MAEKQSTTAHSKIGESKSIIFKETNKNSGTRMYKLGIPMESKYYVVKNKFWQWKYMAYMAFGGGKGRNREREIFSERARR